MNRLTNLAEFDWLLAPEALPRADQLRLTVFHSLADAAEFWLPFQSVATTSLFGTLQWCESWQRHLGEGMGVLPRIVMGQSATGAVQFILPLQVRRRAGLRILEWHGYPDVNYGYGLIAKGFLPLARDWFVEQLPRVLAAAGPHDAVNLHDMPAFMGGAPHPFSAHFNLHAANATFTLSLDPDYETLYRARRVAETRRANARKDHRLQELGKLEFFQARSRGEVEAYVGLMIVQKKRQLAAKGVHGVFGDGETALVRELAEATQDGHPITETHVVALNGEALAVTFGGRVDGTYWFYISCLADHALARKHSPGDYALRKTIEACCASGLKTFDFGVGDAEYKRGWADRSVPLHALLRANHLRALPWVMAQAARLWLLRQVKQRESLRAAAFAIRRLASGSAR